MRWCQAHWDQLRTEVTRQGLDSLVPDTGSAAIDRIVREIHGEQNTDTFDPLMGAMMSMNHFIGESMGPGGHLAVWSYDGCPLCKVDEVHKEGCEDGPDCTYTITQFFKNAVEDEVKRYKEMIENG